MPNLRNRIERLERHSLKSRPSDFGEVQIAALASWADVQLQLLIEAEKARTAQRALTPEESSILQAYESVVQKECINLGFGSVTECQQWYTRMSSVKVWAKRPTR